MRLEIENVPPWDGVYPFDAELTIREYGVIRRLTGYLPAELEHALRGGDQELLASFLVIALCRSGRVGWDDAAHTYSRVVDAAGGAIRLEGDEEAAEELDPTASFNGNTGFSGEPSPTSSATPTLATGIPGSDTSTSPRPP